MNESKKMMKRIVALMLTLCVTLSSVAGYVPTWFAAFAEETEMTETLDGPSDSSETEPEHESHSHSEPEPSHESHSDAGPEHGSHSDAGPEPEAPVETAPEPENHDDGAEGPETSEPSEPSEPGAEAQVVQSISMEEDGPAELPEEKEDENEDVAQEGDVPVDMPAEDEAVERADRPLEETTGDEATDDEVNADAGQEQLTEPETPAEPGEEEIEAGDEGQIPVSEPVQMETVNEEEKTPRPILQDMIDRKLQSVTDTLNSRVEVILKQNTNYEGDITITAGDREVGENFELVLVAEDAGVDGTEGAGYTTISGNVNIKGLRVVMNSVAVSGSKKITVDNRNDTTVDEYKSQGGDLIYNGSINSGAENMTNRLDVSVGLNSSAIIQAIGGNNVLKVEMRSGAKALKVETGSGVDTVDARIYSGDVDISTGGGVDTLKVELEGEKAGEVTADAGSGADRVEVLANGAAKSFEVNAGQGDDTLVIDVRENAGSLTVDGGEGSDTFDIAKGNHHTLESIYYDEEINVKEDANPNSTAILTLPDMSAGDRVTIDAFAGQAIKGVNITGAGASVHLKGTLSKRENPIQYIDPGDPSRGFKLYTTLASEGEGSLNDYTLEITGSAQNNYTDALENKRTVEVDNAETGSYTFTGAVDDFTDYVFRNRIGGLTDITITGTDRPLLLSNVVLDARKLKENDDHITVGDLTANDLNVLITGEVIDLNGKIVAQNVRAQSIQGSRRIGEALANIGSVPFGDIISDVLNVENVAIINVNGEIDARKDIDLVARVRHFGSTVSILPLSVNLLNVKLADAEVNVGNAATLVAGRNLSMEASTHSVTGFNYEKVEKDGQTVSRLVDKGMSVAVSWIVDNAAITVKNGSSVKADADINMEASGEVRVRNVAESSTLGLPVDLALTVINNNVRTTFDGKAQAGGRFRLSSSGKVEDTSTATGSVARGAISGAYLALNIVNQDVKSVIGPGANVTAGGDVQVYSSARANVVTKAISSAAVIEPSDLPTLGGEVGGILKSGLKWVLTGLKSLYEVVRELALKYNAKWFGGQDANDKKMEESFKKAEALARSVDGSNYQVRVVDLDSENAKRGSATVTTADKTDEDGKLIATVKLEPREGFHVKEVRYRYLKAGEDHYTYAKVHRSAGSDECHFVMPDKDVEVIVTYAEGKDDEGDEDEYPDGQSRQEDAFVDILEIIRDIEDGMALFPEEEQRNDDAGDDEEGGEEQRKHPLKLVQPESDGKIVTWLTDTTDPANVDKNLTSVSEGQNVRLVPNPDAGKELESLELSYTIRENGKDKTVKETITADEQGWFYIRVPEGLPEDAELSVRPTFVGVVKEADSDITGALALSVVNNDNRSSIEVGSVVTAGGKVDLFGSKTNIVDTQADGSPVNKDSASGGKKSDPYQPATKSSYSVGGAEYALKMTSNIAGAVDGAVGYREKAGATAYHPIFTVKKDREGSLDKIVISYYSKLETSVSAYLFDTAIGTRKTVELVRSGDGWKIEGGAIDKLMDCIETEKDADGNLIVRTNLTGLGIVQGSTADVDFVFDPEGEEQGETRYLVRNPIQVKYSILRNRKDYSDTRNMGTVSFSRKETDEKGNTRYFFTFSANEEAGYTIHPMDEKDPTHTLSDKAALYASWVGSDGFVQKAPLMRNHDTVGMGEWYFEPGANNLALPEGAVVSINAVFVEDLRELKVVQNDEEKKQGSARVSAAKAKRSDVVEVELNARDGYTGTGIEVLYQTNTQQEKLPGDRITYDESTGKYSFVMPASYEKSSVSIRPVFAAKDIRVTAMGAVEGGAYDSGNVRLSDSTGKAAKGETVTVSPSEELAKKGYKVTELTLKYGTEAHTYENTDKVVIPGDLSLDSVEISVKLMQRAIEVQGYTDEEAGSSVQPISERFDPGNKVVVKINARDGYRVQKGTLKARVQTADGFRQIVLDRQKDGNYSFVLPADAEKSASVTLRCTFEPGSDGPAMSAGVGIGISVVHADNEVEIMGGKVTGGSGISLTGKSLGSSTGTQARAGYSTGNFGIGGAVAVQVAQINSNVKVHRDGNGYVALGQGPISVSAIGMNSFTDIADASGGKKGSATAGDIGVGAGIAVAVDHLESIAEVEDGVRLAGIEKALPVISGITVSAIQRATDQLSAKAGATGGSAYVPAAAVDVNTTDVRARLGKFDLSLVTEDLKGKTDLNKEEALFMAGTLPVAGGAKVNAAFGSMKVEYNHVIAADASAAGAATAAGGAFAVNWVETDVRALLNQSLHTQSAVSVSSSSGDALKSTTLASATGGAKGTNKGSADRKADQMLGGAAKIAGRQGMNGNRINNSLQGRQQAETAESSVSAAGAFILNIQQNKSRAEVLDGVNITAVNAPLSVRSQNRTEATIRSDASATKSNTGVGVGVALNIVTMENIARVGNGAIDVGDLEVVADIAKAPAFIINYGLVENASNIKTAIQSQLEEAIRSILPDNAFFESAGELLSTAVANICDRLIADFKLQDLLNIATDGSVLDRFENAGKMLLDRLIEFPQTLVTPFTSVYAEVAEIAESTGEMGWEHWEDLLTDALKTASVEALGDADQVLKNIIQENYITLIACVMHMTTEKIRGNGWETDSLTRAMKQASTKALSEFTDRLLTTVINKMNDKLPVVSQSNVELTRRIYQELKEKTEQEIEDDLANYFGKVFRTEVYDYEPILMKMQDKGFWEFIKSELKSALKQGTVAMTNDMINKITGGLNVAFEREPKADRHVITTQAISGAGGKTTSGAGSLAIAVADLTTRAEIADSAEGVKASGEMKVDARELRRIRTHSTAAVDAAGTPDNNSGAEDAESENAGGSADSRSFSADGQVTVTTGAGGKAGFSDLDNRVYLVPEPGYALKSAEVTRSYINAEGVETVDILQAEKTGDDYLIMPDEGLDLETLSDEEREKIHINITAEFEPNERDVPTVTFTESAYQKRFVEAGGKAMLSVEGKEGSDATAKAKTGDLVELTIPRVDDIDACRIDVYDKNGKLLARYTPDPEEAPSEGAQIMTQASRNSNEIVYVFRMPEEDIGRIEMALQEGNEEAENEAVDRSGRSVGVGASFTLSYGNSEVHATVGRRDGGVTADTVSVTASSEHGAENYATAGSDPLKGVDDENEKDLGVDAAVSVEILDNDVRAEIAEGTKVTTTGKPDSQTDISREKPGEGAEADDDSVYAVTPGALIIHATERGETETKSNAFSTGSTTAIGASVALNISLSDIRANLGSDASVAGNAVVRAYSKSKDVTYSFASALGASMQRAMNKVAKGAKLTADTANDLTTGKYFDEKSQKSDSKATGTSKKINSRLNERAKQEDGRDASGNLALSNNVLRSRNVQVDNGGDELRNAQNDGNGLIRQEGDQNVSGQDNPIQKKNLQVAATVGVTVALHNAAVNVGGAIDAGGSIELSSQNAGNFNTRSTAAAMNRGQVSGGSTIAAAVGVSVNNNKATVDAADSLKADGDVAVDAKLTQNMSAEYPGRMSVQAIGGALSAKGTDYSIAGAVGVVVSHATARANAGGGKAIQGNRVSISAVDKSKLAVRAGAINVSTGANVGAGISVATIWSGNTVDALVADGTTVTADSFDLIAEKKEINFDDFVFPLNWGAIITDSSALNDEQRENVYPGLFDVHKKAGETSYKVDVNLDTYALMKLPDLLNFLSAQNYYTEAIAGSVITGGSNRLNAAGSVSIVRASNKVNAVMGHDVKLVRRDPNTDGAVKISADGSTNMRLLGGAVSVGRAKAGVGATLTFLYDNDEVKATLGNEVNLATGGDVTHSARANTHAQVFNAAASVNTDAEARATVGGAIDVLLLNNSATASIGDKGKIKADGGLDISSRADMDLLMVNVGAAVGRSTAVGGTVGFTFDNAKALVTIGEAHTLDAQKDINISATAKDSLISVIASASAALASKASVAGALNVLVSGTKAKVNMGGGASLLNSRQGSVALIGETGTRAVNVTVAGAGSRGKAIGMSVNLNFFNRESGVNIDSTARYRITAAKDVLSYAYGKDITVMGALAMAGSVGDKAVSGNLPIVVSRNSVKNTITDGNIRADGEAAFAARLKDETYAIAGSIAMSNADSAVGGTAMVVVRDSTVHTDLGSAKVTADGNAGTLSRRLHDDPGFRGIYLGATAKNDLVTAAAGVSLSGATGVALNLVASTNLNDVKADASKASLKAISSGSVKAEARDDSAHTVISGGASFGLSNGAGAGVDLLISRKKVRALTGEMQAYGDVEVTAEGHEDITQLNVNAGGGKDLGLEVGFSLQALKAEVSAIAGGDVTAENGGFSLKAKNTTDILNASVAAAGAMKTGVAPVIVATVFNGKADALLKEGTITAGRGVSITADSTRDLDQYTIGASGSGTIAASGAVSVFVVKDSTNAVVDRSVSIKGQSLDVSGVSDYKLVGASAAVAGSGTAAGAVNVLVSVLRSNTLAEMEGRADLTGKANVSAESKRDVLNAVASAAGAGTVGIGVTVMVLSVGEKIDQDAADMMTYGNVEKNSPRTFDAGALIDMLKDKGVDTSDFEEQRAADGSVVQTGFSKDLEGNGRTNRDMKAGNGQEFDVASGYNDKDIYNDGDGAGMEAHETEDIRNAKKLGSTVYTEDPTDSVVARIGSDADVAANGVEVLADQTTLADMFGLAAAGAGTVAGGASVAVSTLRSNVFATSLGSVDARNGDVKVSAISRGQNVTPDGDSQESKRMEVLDEALGKEQNFTMRSIRAIGLAAAGAGTVGVGLTAGVIRLDNITRATLGGSVKQAGNIDVRGGNSYENVLAATLAGSGAGTVALSASLGLVLANGEVSSRIDRTADIKLGDEAHKVYVTTDSTVKAAAYTATVALAGTAAATAGVALVTNELKQNTTIDRGARIVGNGVEALDVKGRSNTSAKTGLFGLAISGVGTLGVSVALANLKPTLNTTVGVNGDGTTTLDGMGNVRIANDVRSLGDSSVISASGGLVAVQADVLLVFNKTEAIAKAANLAGSMKRLNIEGDLGAEANAHVADVVAGLGAVGVTVSHVDLDSRNTAALDADGLTADIGALTVRAGKDDQLYRTVASTEAVSAKVGAIVVGVNTSVARNRARNIASITGRGDLKAGSVKLDAYSDSSTDSRIAGFDIGAGSVAVSVISALNEGTSRADMKLGGQLKGSLDARSAVKGATHSGLLTGTGNIIGIGVNVANSYGRTNSFIDVDIAKAPAGKVSIAAQNTGSDDVTSTIDNLFNVSGLSIATMKGASHSQDRYENRVRLGGGDYDVDDVKVTTDYRVTANSEVMPSSSGVNVSLGSVAVNQSITTNTAVALADLSLDNAKLIADHDVTVRTSGSADVVAQVKPAAFTLSGVKVGVNKTVADLSMDQNSGIRLNNAGIDARGAVDVSSIVNRADARAVVSTSGVDKAHEDSVEIGLVIADSNIAESREGITGTASIVGAAGENRLKAANLNIYSGNADSVVTTSQTETNGAATVGLLAVGNLEGTATSGDKFYAQLDGVNADIIGDARMKAQTNTQACGLGTMPGGLKVIGVGISKIRASVGTMNDRETAKVLIGRNTTLTADTVSLDALNQGHANADIRRSTSVALGNVGESSQPTESWYDTGVSVEDGAKLKARKEIIEELWDKDESLRGKYSMSITSDTRAQASSVVKSSQYGVGLNLNTMKGENNIHDENNIKFGENSVLDAAGSINIRGSSAADAEARTELDGGSVFDGSSADVNNTVERIVRVNIRDGAMLKSHTGTLNITSISGDGDHIVTQGKVTNSGGITVGKCNANAKVTSQNQILVGEEAELVSYADINLLATATSRNGYNPEAVDTKADIDTKGFAIVPHANANTDLTYTTYIDINRDGERTTQLNTNGMELHDGRGANINITVNNAGLSTATRSGTDCKGAVGGSYSRTEANIKLYNNIWVDQTSFMSAGSVALKANNGEGNMKPLLLASAFAELYGAAGEVASNLYFKGDPYNQIKSNDILHVRFTARNKIVHEAVLPLNSTILDRTNPVRREGAIRDVSVWESKWEDLALYRCDFCGEGSSHVIDTITDITESANNGNRGSSTLSNAGVPYFGNGMGYSWEGSLLGAANFIGSREYDIVNSIYQLDGFVRLDQDLSMVGMDKYLLWKASTDRDVYLLPNGARLYMNGTHRLDYVAENTDCDVYGNGTTSNVSVILALSEAAEKNPLVSIDRAGVLNFTTGELELPERDAFVLYLKEVSSRWLLGELEAGRLTPVGESVGTPVPGESREDWRQYWLGDTPETAEDPDQTLIFLLVNEKTDEVDAFRTSVSMLSGGQKPVDVSLLIDRDDEQYRVEFHDTPENNRSLVLIQDRDFRVFLRDIKLPGVVDPVYSICDQMFTMVDFRGGSVSLFNGQYTATFDGDVFESKNLRIEGIASGMLRTTIRKGQYVWLEREDERVKDAA